MIHLSPQHGAQEATLDWNDFILKAMQEANRNYPGGCPACKGIRFKRCSSCGEEVNSFHDFRDYQRPPQMYPTLSDWYREGEPRPEQKVPERRGQP
jgi:hypothetical protein